MEKMMTPRDLGVFRAVFLALLGTVDNERQQAMVCLPFKPLAACCFFSSFFASASSLSLLARFFSEAFFFLVIIVGSLSVSCCGQSLGWLTYSERTVCAVVCFFS